MEKEKTSCYYTKVEAGLVNWSPKKKILFFPVQKRDYVITHKRIYKSFHFSTIIIPNE